MPEGVRFQPGNPGRPKGSRNKLGEAFIHDMHEAWKLHGAAAIARVVEEKPEQFLKVVASLMPKQVEVKAGDFDELGDSELAALIMAGRQAAQAAQSSGGGTASQGGEEPPGDVPAVH